MPRRAQGWTSAPAQTVSLQRVRKHHRTARARRCTLRTSHHAAPNIASGGQDKLLKLWSLREGAAPTLLGKQNLQIGGIFDLSFSRDSPALVAAGGAKGKLGVWNTLELEEMQSLLPNAEAAIGIDGRVLGGAVAGMGALDVNSSSEDESNAVAPDAAATAARKARRGKKTAKAR